MWEGQIIENIISLVIGVLLILFRKEFAKLVIWYHRRRWYRRKNVKLKEYPEKAWLAGNYFAQCMAVILGLFIATLSILSLLGIIKTKP